MTTITVFGGTGFLGRRLVLRLAAEGASVRVAVRHPDPARSALRTAGLNQITLFSADVRDQTSVAAAGPGDALFGRSPSLPGCSRCCR